MNINERKAQLQSQFLQLSRQVVDDPGNLEMFQQMAQIRLDLNNIETSTSLSSLPSVTTEESESNNETNTNGSSITENKILKFISYWFNLNQKKDKLN